MDKQEQDCHSNNYSLGIIETRGRASLIEATDSAVKAASVTLKASYCVGGGLNAVTLVGDVAAMRAALDAAQATLQRLSASGTTHLIPRLAPDVWDILEGDTPNPKPAETPASPKPKTRKRSKKPAASPVPPEEQEPSI